jgi:hypothetical protein
MFDDTTAEGIYYQFLMPSEYAGTPVINLLYSMESATSGTIGFDVSIWAASPGESVDTPAYDTANGGSETVPATAGLSSLLAISLTNDNSMVADDMVYVKIFRQAADTATGDCELRAINIQYDT